MPEEAGRPAGEGVSREEVFTAVRKKGLSASGRIAAGIGRYDSDRKKQREAEVAERVTCASSCFFGGEMKLFR